MGRYGWKNICELVYLYQFESSYRDSSGLGIIKMNDLKLTIRHVYNHNGIGCTRAVNDNKTWPHGGFGRGDMASQAVGVVVLYWTGK